MLRLGLTGGIGSGKTTVAGFFRAHGAVVIDADVLSRQATASGGLAIEPIRSEFGADYITADGALDRAKVAGIVFADPEALKDLNAIVHPAVGAEISRRVNEQVPTDHVVVLDIPLLTENPRDGLQGKIVVDVPVEVQVDRLVRFRGFDEADARTRIARQSTREQRLDGASFVVDNSGDLDDLAPQIDALWTWLLSLPQLPEDHQFGGRSESPEEPAE